MSQKDNRPSIQPRLAQAITGIEKRLQGVSAVVLVGVSYTPAEAIQLFQGAVDSARAVASAKARWHDAVVADRSLRTSVLAALFDLQNLARAFFANAMAPLADLGFSPRKTSNKRTTAVAAQAVVKANATRVARHTLGRKQRQAVKGVVEVAVAPLAPEGGARPASAHPATLVRRP